MICGAVRPETPASPLEPHELKYAERTINLATENAIAGGRPFGAVLVADSGMVFTAVNRAEQTNDPTTHAEIEVLRAAAQRLHERDLADCTIYASCEPCVMCAAALRLSRVRRVIYCCRRETAATFGFTDIGDPTVSRRLLANTDVLQVAALEAAARRPFELWVAGAKRP
jgi:guanine deaminase